MENEIVKRLAPTKDTLTLLFSLSGNVSAFPDCNKGLMEIILSLDRYAISRAQERAAKGSMQIAIMKKGGSIAILW